MITGRMIAWCAIGVFAALAAQWWLDTRERRRVEQQRAKWLARRDRIAGIRCPWSGRTGIDIGDGLVVACPHCGDLWIADPDQTLPEHQSRHHRA